MCGIIAYAGVDQAVEPLLSGMDRLAYRGYDSNGIVTQNGSSFVCEKQPGPLSDLLDRIDRTKFTGTAGIGHTRWATHGAPTQLNAHPHFSCDEDITVVHNGIIENFQELKEGLIDRGHTIRSETDTEVIPHLLEEAYEQVGDPVAAVRSVTEKVRGSYAIAVMFQQHPGEIIGACNQSPLLIGQGEDAQYLASDIPALLHFTREVIYLQDGELARITSEGTEMYSRDGEEVFRAPETIDWNVETAEKEGYEHFMLKEIFEQPEALRNTLAGRIDEDETQIDLECPELTPERLEQIDRIQVVACGTSYHAGLIAKYYLEELAGISAEVRLASEFRYAPGPVDDRTMFIGISQSGETADTLAAHGIARERGAFTLSVCNVIGSTLARKSDEVIYARAGPEIGVAATKTYTAQIVSLLLLSLYLGQKKAEADGGDVPAPSAHSDLVEELAALPETIEQVLETSDGIERIAEAYHDTYNFMFIGRCLNYPTALEGALKLKEISYIHAEGYAGGEMKHGPLALVEDTFPTVAIAPDDRVYDKMVSNVQEISARDGELIGLVSEGETQIADLCEYTIELPACAEHLSPVLYTVPLQLLAYHVGAILGRDIDQPRNLAKSVTVE